MKKVLPLDEKQIHATVESECLRVSEIRKTLGNSIKISTSKQRNCPVKVEAAIGYAKWAMITGGKANLTGALKALKEIQL